MTAGFTTLDFDPCPGDPDAVLALARTWRQAAIKLTQVALRLDGTDDESTRWRGRAADSFRNELSTHRTTLGKVRSACAAYSQLLGQWADMLRDFQEEAHRIDALAGTVDDRRRQAAHAIGAERGGGLHAVENAVEDLDPFHLAHDLRAQNHLEELTAQANALDAKAQRLHERYLDAARSLAHQTAEQLDLPAGQFGWYGQQVDASELSSLMTQNPDGGPDGPLYDQNVSDALDFFDDHIDDSGGFLWSDAAQGGAEVLGRLRSLSPQELDAFFLSLTPAQLAQLNAQIGEGSSWWGGGSADNGVRVGYASLLFGSLSGAALQRVQESMPELEPSPLAADKKRGLTYQPADGPLFGPDGPDIKQDLQQGQAGDCWFLSSVAAATERDPQFPQQHVHENPNGSYTVTFYNDGKPVYVTVDNRLPTDANGNQQYAQTPGSTWMAVYEKAYAQYKGSYDAIGNGGYGDNGLRDITGRSAQRVDSGDLSLADLARKIGHGYAVESATRDDAALVGKDDRMDNHQIVASHEYSVERVNLNANPPTITLLNPWGPPDVFSGDPAPQEMVLTQDQWRKYFQDASFTDTKV